MVEVVVRELEKTEEDGTEVWKVKKLLSEYYWPQQVQVSFNSWEHLVIRFSDEQLKTDDEGNVRKEAKDVLIVFDKQTTLQILKFLAKWVKMKEEV